MPPVTPTHWRGVRLANRFGAVCPQRIPELNPNKDGNQKARNQTSSKTGTSSSSSSSPPYPFNEPPEGRIGYLKRIVTFLRNQSEDCLHLNIYAPYSSQGNSNLWVMNTSFSSNELLHLNQRKFKCFLFNLHLNLKLKKLIFTQITKLKQLLYD